MLLFNWPLMRERVGGGRWGDRRWLKVFGWSGRCCTVLNLLCVKDDGENGSLSRSRHAARHAMLHTTNGN